AEPRAAFVHTCPMPRRRKVPFRSAASIREENALAKLARVLAGHSCIRVYRRKLRRRKGRVRCPLNGGDKISRDEAEYGRLHKVIGRRKIRKDVDRHAMDIVIPKDFVIV